MRHNPDGDRYPTVCVSMELCPYHYDEIPSDSDGNGVGDNCQNYPEIEDYELVRGTADDPDPDLDGWAVEDDNCPNVQNWLQEDSDNDGIGDLCDVQ